MYNGTTIVLAGLMEMAMYRGREAKIGLTFRGNTMLSNSQIDQIVVLVCTYFHMGSLLIFTIYWKGGRGNIPDMFGCSKLFGLPILPAFIYIWPYSLVAFGAVSG